MTEDIQITDMPIHVNSLTTQYRYKMNINHSGGKTIYTPLCLHTFLKY
jgi:hypothetical protein